MIGIVGSIRNFLVNELGIRLGDKLNGESSGILSSIAHWVVGMKTTKMVDEQIKENDTSLMSYEEYFKYRNDHVERLELERVNQKKSIQELGNH